LKKRWCIGELTTDFLWLMEKTLDIYGLPYNPKRPQICFDESPYQLINDVVDPIPMKPGSVKKEDHHYNRNGVCQILIAFEPLTGQRFIQVREQRTKKDYAEFMKEVAEKLYPDAEKIVVVQDNLNTHNPGSFYKILPPKEAFELAERFDMHYTPKKASWLNMVEIELSVLSKQCLDRRIGDIKTVKRELLQWVKDRNEKNATVSWQFTKNMARDKFKKFYPTSQN